MKYWILDLLLPIIYCIIFLIDLIVNFSLIKKNKFNNYLKQYTLRFIFNLILIGSSILSFAILIESTDDNELLNLKLFAITSRLCIYVRFNYYFSNKINKLFFKLDYNFII